MEHEHQAIDEPYEAPTVRRLGSVAEITQENNAGTLADQVIQAGESIFGRLSY